MWTDTGFIAEPWGALTEEEVSSFEALSECTLPVEYREFLLATNGGRPSASHEYVYIPGNPDPLCDIQLFFGILPEGPDYANLQLIREWYADRLPENMIPIAADSGGNLLLVDMRQRPGTGGVYFWQHDSANDDSDQPELTRVASTFRGLLEQTGRWSLPGTPAWLQSIEQKAGHEVIDMIESGLSVHVMYDGRSIIEYAAIHGLNDLIELLAAKGANLGNALQLAVQNAEFSPEHESTVLLLRRLAELNGRSAS